MKRMLRIFCLLIGIISLKGVDVDDITGSLKNIGGTIGDVTGKIGDIASLDTLKDITKTDLIKGTTGFDILHPTTITQVPGALEEGAEEIYKKGTQLVTDPKKFLMEAINNVVKANLAGIDLLALKKDFDELSKNTGSINSNINDFQNAITKKGGLVDQIKKTINTAQTTFKDFSKIIPTTVATFRESYNQAQEIKKEIFADLDEFKNFASQLTSGKDLPDKIAYLETLGNKFLALQKKICKFSEDQEPKLKTLNENLETVQSDLSQMTQVVDAFSPKETVLDLSKLTQTTSNIFATLTNLQKDFGPVVGKVLINDKLRDSFNSTSKDLENLTKTLADASTTKQPESIVIQIERELLGVDLYTKLPDLFDTIKDVETFIHTVNLLCENDINPTRNEFVDTLITSFKDLYNLFVNANFEKMSEVEEKIEKSINIIKEKVEIIQKKIQDLDDKRKKLLERKALIEPIKKFKDRLPELQKQAIEIQNRLQNTLQTLPPTLKKITDEDIKKINQSIKDLQNEIKATSDFVTGIPDRMKNKLQEVPAVLLNVSNVTNPVKAFENILKEPAHNIFNEEISGLTEHMSALKKKLAIVLQNIAQTMKDSGILEGIAIKTPLLILQQNLNVSLPQNINSTLDTVINIMGNKLPQDLIDIANNL